MKITNGDGVSISRHTVKPLIQLQGKIVGTSDSVKTIMAEMIEQTKKHSKVISDVAKLAKMTGAGLPKAVFA